MPAIILDRDGVINRDSANFIKSVDEWEALPGSLEAIARLAVAGWQIAVCTNQSGIARGLLHPATLQDIHDHLRVQVQELGGRIDGIYACPHGPEHSCGCRKPAPGLLLAAARDLGFVLAGTPVIGDTARDLTAAANVGARPILVRTGKAEDKSAAGIDTNVEVYDDLRQAVSVLLGERTMENP